MLKFAECPDVLFRKVFRRALSLTIDEIWMFHLDSKGGSENWEEWGCSPYPDEYAKMFGGPKPIRDQLQKLLKAFDEGELYDITDYSWLLIHFSMICFCDQYNDMFFEDHDCHIKINGEVVKHLEYGYPKGNERGLFSYFWDDDFLWNEEKVNEISAQGIRELCGITEETLSISNRWAPNPQDLSIELVTDRETLDNFYESRDCNGHSWRKNTNTYRKYFKMIESNGE